NHDGVINSQDPGFNQLKVWVDANGDAKLDAGELVSLPDLGISSISLQTTPSGRSINGNTVVSSASFTINGVSNTISEVDFSTSTMQTIYTPPPGFAYAPAALTLPQLDGYGKMTDLRVAMSQDAHLLADVKSLIMHASTMTGAQFDGAFEAVVQEWAGASGIDPASRGA